MTEPEVYRTPNIRQLALDTLQQRLEQRRNRRLIDAIEVNQKREAKRTAMNAKSAEKFDKLIERASSNLDKAKELMNKAEDALHEATAIHNSMTLLE